VLVDKIHLNRFTGKWSLLQLGLIFSQNIDQINIYIDVNMSLNMWYLKVYHVTLLI